MCKGAGWNGRMDNTILRAGTKQESKSKWEVSASADFSLSLSLYKNYLILTKTLQFQTIGFWTHVHVRFCWGIREGRHPESRTLHPQSHLIPIWKGYKGFKCHIHLPFASPAAHSPWSHVHHRHTFQPNRKLLCGHDAPHVRCIVASAAGMVLCTAEVPIVSKPAQVRNKEQGEEIPPQCWSQKGMWGSLESEWFYCFHISLLKSPKILAAKPAYALRKGIWTSPAAASKAAAGLRAQPLPWHTDLMICAVQGIKCLKKLALLRRPCSSCISVLSFVRGWDWLWGGQEEPDGSINKRHLGELAELTAQQDPCLAVKTFLHVQRCS